MQAKLVSSLISRHWQLDVLPLSGKQNCHVYCYVKKNHHFKVLPPFLLSPQLLLLSTVAYDIEYSFDQSVSPVLAAYPPTPCAPPASHCQGSRKVLGSVQHCSATTEKSVWHHRYFHHPKHSTMWVSMKKINSISVKPWQHVTIIWFVNKELTLLPN